MWVARRHWVTTRGTGDRARSRVVAHDHRLSWAVVHGRREQLWSVARDRKQSRAIAHGQLECTSYHSVEALYINSVCVHTKLDIVVMLFNSINSCVSVCVQISGGIYCTVNFIILKI